MLKPTHICIHHTAVSLKANPDQWKATNEYHRKQWNFKSSLGFFGGYNYEVAANGSIKQFRADGERTAAQYQPYDGITYTNDGRVLSICLDGNFDIENPTDDQKRSVKLLLEQKMRAYGIPRSNIIKHRDVALNAQGKPLKSCPGNNLPDDVATFFLGKSTNIPEPVVNNIQIPVYRDAVTGRIYIKRNMLYYWVKDEATFKAVFGSFEVVKWPNGDTPPINQIAGTLSLTK